MSAILVEGLVKQYPGGVRAVDGAELEVREGEVFGLLGPNGAGKSTTVGVCTTRIRPSAGRVRVAGVDVLADPALAKRSMGVVTQYNTLDRSCTVRENLYFHARYFGASRAVARARADELLERFRLADRAEAMPDQLSGGMAQRLQLGRAIAHGPRVLFLDEPTSGLDPQSRLALWELVRELGAQGTTVLLTTHNMEEADRLCARVAILDHGKVLVCDTPEELKRGTGAVTVVELGVARGAEELVPALERLPTVQEVVSGPDGLRLMLRGPHESLLPRLVDLTREHGLRELRVFEPTLETVFIGLTGRALRE